MIELNQNHILYARLNIEKKTKGCGVWDNINQSVEYQISINFDVVFTAQVMMKQCGQTQIFHNAPKTLLKNLQAEKKHCRSFEKKKTYSKNALMSIIYHKLFCSSSIFPVYYFIRPIFIFYHCSCLDMTSLSNAIIFIKLFQTVYLINDFSLKI